MQDIWFKAQINVKETLQKFRQGPDSPYLYISFSGVVELCVTYHVRKHWKV